LQILNEPFKLKRLIQQNRIDEILPDSILKTCELCKFSRDESVLVADTTMPYFYFFVSGKLKVFQMHENGKAILIQFYSHFDSLGEVELMSDVDTSCSVSAVSSSELIRIPMAVLKAEALDYPPFLRYMIRSLATKLLVADRHHASNLLYPVINRLSSYIYAHENDNQEVVIKESLQDVSEFIGTSYRQLHRAFETLEAKGIIKRTNKRILVLNKDHLKLIAGDIYGGE